MRLYIAGPYSKGDVALNVREAIVAADILLNKGHKPYIPHLNHLWHLVKPHDYETWLALDMAYLAVCEALVRLPGESPGAEREVAFAHKNGISVYYSIEEFLDNDRK